MDFSIVVYFCYCDIFNILLSFVDHFDVSFPTTMAFCFTFFIYEINLIFHFSAVAYKINIISGNMPVLYSVRSLYMGSFLS